MPNFFPEGNTPLPTDSELRSLTKAVSLLGEIAANGGGGGGGGITDAPSNSKTYGRKDGAWEQIAPAQLICYAEPSSLYDYNTGEFITYNRNIVAVSDLGEDDVVLNLGSLGDTSGGSPSATLRFIGGQGIKSLRLETSGDLDLTFDGAPSLVSLENLEFGYLYDSTSFNFASNDGLSSLKTLVFNNYCENITLGGLAGLSSLETLTFDGCGIFDISTSTGLSSLTTINIGGVQGTAAANTGHVTISSTSGMTALTTLNISSMFGNLTISDVSGFINLTSVTMVINDSTNFNTTNIQDSATTLPEAKALLILNALDENEPSVAEEGPILFQGTIELKVTGTSTLTAVKASLESKGFTVTLTTP